jgi:anti-anti-sigma factor
MLVSYDKYPVRLSEVFIWLKTSIKKRGCMTGISFDSVNLLHLPFVDKFEEIRHVRILRFKGAIDTDILPDILKLKNKLEKHGDIKKNNVLIDFKKITHVDSAAIAVLLILLSELKEHDKKLGLINVTEELKNMLDIFKAGKVFMIFDSEEEALESFS